MLSCWSRVDVWRGRNQLVGGRCGPGRALAHRRFAHSTPKRIAFGRQDTVSAVRRIGSPGGSGDKTPGSSVEVDANSACSSARAVPVFEDAGTQMQRCSQNQLILAEHGLKTTRAIVREVARELKVLRVLVVDLGNTVVGEQGDVQVEVQVSEVTRRSF
jgi:hypothetical protein